MQSATLPITIALCAAAQVWALAPVFGLTQALVYVVAGLSATFALMPRGRQIPPGKISPALVEMLRKRAASVGQVDNGEPNRRSPPLDSRHRRPQRLRLDQWPQPDLYLGGERAGTFAPRDPDIVRAVDDFGR